MISYTAFSEFVKNGPEKEDKCFVYHPIETELIYANGDKFKPSNGLYGFSFTAGTYKPDIYLSLAMDGTLIIDPSQESEPGYVDSVMALKFHNIKLFDEGEPAMKSIIMYISPGIAKALVSQGMLLELWADPAGKIDSTGYYEVHLDQITFDEFKVGKYSAYEYANVMLADFRTKSELKVIEHFLYTQCHVATPEVGAMSETDTFLKKHGVVDGKFDPGFSKQSAAYWLDVKIEGLSNTAKVSDVITRIQNGKKQTTPGAEMAKYVPLYENMGLDPLINAKEDKSETLESLRDTLRDMRYGMFLEGKWFDEFDESGEENKIINENYNVAFRRNNITKDLIGS